MLSPLNMNRAPRLRWYEKVLFPIGLVMFFAIGVPVLIVSALLSRDQK
jgi:hypothetical protein